jgi:hypothetical protein
MSRRRNLVFGGSLIAAIALLGMVRAGLEVVDAAVPATQMVQAPMFEIDPFWPKPLPNGWVYGTVIGVTVDAQDNVYIVHRGVVGTAEDAANADPPQAECCASAPPTVRSRG